jgi:hypothetical protein
MVVLQFLFVGFLSCLWQFVSTVEKQFTQQKAINIAKVLMYFGNCYTRKRHLIGERGFYESQ